MTAKSLVKVARLSMRQYRPNGNSPSPAWVIGTDYSDWLVELHIRHDAMETQLTLYLVMDGEYFEVVTSDELKERKETAQQHGQTYANEFVHSVSKHDGLLRVKDELVARWTALQYIVSPTYTI
jgi:hypothetical protein